MRHGIRHLSRFLLLFLTMGLLATPALASVDWDVTKTLRIPTTPLDVTASVDGKWLYVLGEGGKLYIFSENGTLEDTISVDPGMERIANSGLQPANIQDRLYLASGKTKSVQVVNVDFSVSLNIQGSPFVGPENAPVTIVEFSDFECPYCSQVGLLNEAILAKYPNQVKVVFKQFPLSFHKQAQSAAMAALAAHQQGKFWQYHDLLFENHKALSEAKYIELAKQAGIDLEKFNKSRVSPATQQHLENDIMEGKKVGVQGTPTIFINGRRLKSRTFEAMQQMVDQELAKRKK